MEACFQHRRRFFNDRIGERFPLQKRYYIGWRNRRCADAADAKTNRLAVARTIDGELKSNARNGEVSGPPMDLYVRSPARRMR